ncbi:MAG: LacI family DNA-binding transcriptional regulator [Actinomycetota bacterium]|nr:LacI family DNA-binding transcriptional regulator [Actinomycetota bacterium]MDQ2957250.1 LacI family DNA-binding transcriptional regulator [Actinomycetota bacterium]
MLRGSEDLVRPTIESVASHAGVSRQTVSNALNAPERLKPETLARVLDSISSLGYRPSQSARNLRTQSTRLIGFRFARSAGSGIASIEDRFLHALCSAARDRGYGVLVFAADADDDELAVYEDLLSRGAVDAFVLMNTHHGDPRPPWLSAHEVPFVSFGRPWQRLSKPHSWVDVDGRRGLRLVVEHLVAAGHRRIGFLGWPEHSEVGRDRHQGWLDGIEAAKLPTHQLTAHGHDGIAVGSELAERLLSRRHPPTALACVSDAVAVGAMRAVEQRGLAVGRDVAVVGFDDSPLATVVTPGLSSVRQPLESVAEKCVDLLLRQISDHTAIPLKLVVPPTLIVRGSSQPAGSTPAIPSEGTP